MKTLPTGALFLFLCIICSTGCSQSVGPQMKEEPVVSAFAKGADISWLPQMEASGYKFYNDNGVQEDCFKILKDHGINSIRLRTFVDPSDDPFSGHCSKTWG
jgi:arabinogalactan endo-1,4-beta-galactosidase